MKIGYIGKKQDGPSAAVQRKRIGALDVPEERVYSGNLDHFVKALRPGDRAVVYGLDQLGEGVDGVLTALDRIAARGAVVVDCYENDETELPWAQGDSEKQRRILEVERRFRARKTAAAREARRKKGAYAKGGRPRSIPKDDQARCRRIGRTIMKRPLTLAEKLTAFADETGYDVKEWTFRRLIADKRKT